MKHQNYQHVDLPLIDFHLPGVEVVELHGSFADAQWRSAIERLPRTPKEKLVDQWTTTTAWRVPASGVDLFSQTASWRVSVGGKETKR